MKFCSDCGSDKIELAIPEGDNRTRFVCGNCERIFYTNPNIVAGCLPVKDDKVLLCKRDIEPRKGFWNIPAGYMENGESVEEGALREVWEEALAKAEIQGLICLYSIPRINQVYILFRAELNPYEYGIGEESQEVEWFTEEEIPWDDIAFTSSTFALKKYFSDKKKGEFKTHFGRLDF